MRSGWDAGQLRDLFSTMGVAPRDVLRGKGALAGELGLNDANASDEAIMEAMVLHPVLVNRPIVVTPKGARLCRPAEKVFALLDKTPVSFVKENGDTVSC
jgi:arsenate reductase